MTRASELTDVGQGLAAGCLAIGVTAITSSHLALEIAFRRAWRDWPPSHKFRYVRADLNRNDIRQIIVKSERRRGAFLGAWQVSRWAEPYLHDGNDLDDAAELLPEWTGVLWDKWLQLAELFVANLKDDEVVREGDDARTSD